MKLEKAQRHGFADIKSYELSRRWARLSTIQRTALLAALRNDTSYDCSFTTIRAIWRAGYLENDTGTYDLSHCWLSQLGRELAEWGRDHEETDV